MSYNLIKSINEQVLKKVQSPPFPYQYGTMGSLLASIMLPVLGSEALNFLKQDFNHEDLMSDRCNPGEIREYLSKFQDDDLSRVSRKIFDWINQEYLGIFKNFFDEEVWQIDNQLATLLEGYEEFRDSILLFVYSVPILPVSMTFRDFCLHFHVFEADEDYVEIQAILSDYYTETVKCQKLYLSWKHIDCLSEEECQSILSLLEHEIPFTCDGCGKDIKHMKHPYISRIEIYPSRSAMSEGSKENEFEPVGTAPDSEQSMPRAEKEVTKEMWTEYRLFMCTECRQTFIKRIEGGEFI